MTPHDEKLNKAKAFLQDLEDRKILYHSTDLQTLTSLLALGKRTYMGIDPTANFLHLGHYAGLTLLKRFIASGFPVVILVGSLTARIGDPSFRSKSRKFNPNIDQNGKELVQQLTSLFSKELTMKAEDGSPMCEIIDNYDFHNKRLLTNATFQNKPIDILLEFINEVCAEIKAAELANREFLRDRMQEGLTIAEFLYTGLQGWDFLHLSRDKNVAIQIGGSDQWGNMLTGLHLISKHRNKELNLDDSEISIESEDKLEEYSEAGVITFSIIEDGKGNKFGKSEGNAIRISGGDSERNIYDVRQYLINAPDTQIWDYLAKFTYLPLEEINNLVNEDIREAKNKLANLICSDIFGNDASTSSSLVVHDVFKGLSQAKSYKNLIKFSKHVPAANCIWQEDLQLSSLFELTGLVKSKSEFNRLVSSNGIYVSGATEETLKQNAYKLKEEYVMWSEEDKSRGIVTLRKGKKNYALVHISRGQDVFEIE